MSLKMEVSGDQIDEPTSLPMNEVTLRGEPSEIGALKAHPGFKDIIESPSVRIPTEDIEPQPDTESGESVLAIRLIGKTDDIQFAVKMFESIVAQVSLHEHDRQRAIAEARAKTVEKTPIGEALRKKFIELLSEDAPLTPNLLSKIIRMAESGRDLLAAEKITLDQLGLIGRKRRKNPMGLGIYQGGYEEDLDGDGIVGMGALGGALAPAPPVENFGMQAIREMVEGLRTANDSPLKLVEALAAARSAGMKDVAAALEKKLGIEPEAKPPAAVLRGPGAKPAVPALPATVNDGNGTHVVPPRETCRHCQWPKISHGSDGKRFGCSGFEPVEAPPTLASVPPEVSGPEQGHT